MRQTSDGDGLEADLVAWGRVIVLETIGRVSRRPRRTAIGFVEEPDGSLLVAASGDSSDWARNLLAEPDCVVERDGVRRPHRAVPLSGEAHDHAVRSLILRYGTPSERLGGGPAFRLLPST